ncbi:hypothetical protein [Cellulomonas sp. NPDC058312]|uniref:hypothetical protein n=1 Tax=Cellulomonas sp. NPDC058312 TaxID=3346441 RepID=UPI0036E36898
MPTPPEPPPPPPHPGHPRRRPRGGCLVALGVVGVVAVLIGVPVGLVILERRPEAWEREALLTASPFARIVTAGADRVEGRSRPQTQKFGRYLEGVSTEAVFWTGLTLDDVADRVAEAVQALDLGDPLCIQLDAGPDAYELTARQSATGALWCNVFDRDSHALGAVIAWQDGAQVTVLITYGPGRGYREWPGITPTG